LNSHRVKYVVIGGTAAVLYGVPRATFDLDILIEATPENASGLLDAFREAGFGTAPELAAKDDLIASKRAAGRKIDLEDIRILEQE
jgi:hypothetical protein